MLKIEVYDLKHSLIESKTFQFSEIFIGRAKTCDLILPDAHISRQHIHLSQKRDGSFTLYIKGKSYDFSEFFELKDSGYIFKFHNLDLISDHVTQEIQIPTRKNFSFLHFVVIATTLLMSFLADIYIDYYDTHFTRRIQNILFVMAITGGLAIIFSFISKAINHIFHFRKFIQLHLLFLIFFIFIYHDLFGLRWVLPSFGLLNYDELFLLLCSGFFFLYLYQISLLLFPHLPKKFRLLGSFGLYLLCLLPLSLKYVPNKNSTRYMRYTVTPPLYEPFETKAIAPNDYLILQKALFTE